MKPDSDGNGVLIAAADAEIRAALLDALGGAFRVRSVDNAAHILEILDNGEYGTVFFTSGMPGLSPSELLEIIADKNLKVKAVIAAKADEQHTRADAFEAGAQAVLVHPFDHREAVWIALNLQQRSMHEENVARYVKGQIGDLIELFGEEDAALRKTLNRVIELSKLDKPALFQGEPGTGKGLLARIMALSGYSPLGVFKSFSARGKTPSEIEEALFGNKEKKGIIEQAAGGSLMIHGVSHVPIRLQDRICRSINFHLGQIRFMFSDRSDIHGALLRSEFHEDLWKILENNIVTVPRLRDRPDSIGHIAQRTLERYAEMMGSPVRSIHSSALLLLKNYLWPGNLEELERVLALAVGRATGSILLPDDLPFAAKPRFGEGIENLSIEEAVSIKLYPLVDTIEDLPEGELYKLVLSKMERPLFKLVLDKLGGNKVRAAKALGLHRNTLRKKLKELGLS